MAIHNDKGKLGEQLAREYLEAGGYEILDANWTCLRAEIDLVARFEGRIVFVEVKTRSGTAFGMPEDFVGKAKQKLLCRAADEYIYLTKHQGEVRFDIVSVLFTGNEYSIRHIEDAFWPMG